MNAKIHDAVVNSVTSSPNLIIVESDIKGAGQGLFTNQYIIKGRPICEYKGNLLTAEEASNLPRSETLYLLGLGNPSVSDSQGKVFTRIDANPNSTAEIGYGGFANDLYTKYPQELIDCRERFAKETHRVMRKYGTYFSSLNVNKKMSPADRKKLRKAFKKAISLENELYEKYAAHGYNGIFVRIPGVPGFLMMSLKDIYPGQEIYVPYGDEYWELI